MLHQSTVRQLQIEGEGVATIDQALRDEQCHRCGGLMIKDHCLDVLSDSAEVEVKVMRCCACGELIDPTILRNRMRGPKLSIKRESQRKSHDPKPNKLLSSNSFMTQILETWSAAICRDHGEENSATH